MMTSGTTLNTTSDVERELALKRQQRRQARYEQLCVTIERTQRKFEKADRVVKRSLAALAKLERKRIREQKALKALAATLADALVATQVESPAEPMLSEGDGLDVPSFLRRDSNNKLAAMPDPRTKEKKAERRAVAREVLEAELTGKRRKMPLAGRAASAALKA